MLKRKKNANILMILELKTKTPKSIYTQIKDKSSLVKMVKKSKKLTKTGMNKLSTKPLRRNKNNIKNKNLLQSFANIS